AVNFRDLFRGLALVCAMALPASAATITGTYTNDGDPLNQANGIFPSTGSSGPFELTSFPTSTGSTYSFVDFTLTPDEQFRLNSMTSLSATFSSDFGGSAGGSPRITLWLDNGGFIQVYLGTPPSFTTANIGGFSGLNLDNATNDAGYENSGSYVTLASLDATYGADL